MSARRAGLSAAALVIVLALIVVALLDPATFGGWVAVVGLSSIAVETALAQALASGGLPRVAALSRPTRGTLLLGVTVVLGLLVTLVLRWVVAAGWGIDFPGLAMYCIVAVVAALWLFPVCGGWPFTLLPGRLTPAIAGFAAVHVLAFAAYRLLFDLTPFGLPTGPGLRSVPHGAFFAWDVLVFLVTAISGLFLAPVLRLGGPSGPARALPGTLACLAWGAVLYGVGVGVFGMDPVGFMVAVPVPVLFGGLIVVVLTRGGFYPGQPQGRWANGLATLATIIVMGTALVWVFRGVLALTHPELAWGAPRYGGEIWIANATLAFTFGLLSVVSDFYDLWPVTRSPQPAAATEEAAVQPA